MRARLLVLLALMLACIQLHAQVAVVNGASFRKEQPVAAGSIASAFGTFGTVTATSAPGTPLPTTLADVRVLVNNIESPLFYVSSGQINFQVPAALTPGRYPIRVLAPGGEPAPS